ncbi:hypothetical protein BH11BAC2_BH11BAC2_10250 [soil metagenome]
MKTTSIILIFIIGLTFFACNNSQTQNKLAAVDSLSLDKKVTSEELKPKITADTLYKLLDNALNLDTFEFANWDPFLFIQTGSFLSTTEKNAILVSCPTDSTYKIELYSKNSDRWVENDELEDLDAFSPQFYTDYNDYNFDGQKDIYLQCSSSNGYSLSRGHLLTINSKTKKIENHPETRDLANMKPDLKTKTVFSETVYYDSLGFRGICTLTNNWVRGKLKTIKKECSDRETN